MSQTRQRRTAQPEHQPRNYTAVVTAVIAGFLIVLVAIVVIFYSELRDTASELAEETRDELVGDESRPGETDPARSDDPEDYVYVEATVGFPRSLNPLLAESTSERSVAAMLYRSLMQANAEGDPEPDLASNWTVSDDGLTHTIHLDDDARWHDGELITAADVLFTISLVQDPGFPGDRDLALFWKAITVAQVDEQTIEFRLMEPYVGFGHYLKLPILPRHQFSAYLPEDLVSLELDTSLVGSGPYSISEIDLDAAEIHFQPVDNDASNLSSVVFRYYDNRPEAIGAFLEGEVDGVSYIPIEELHANEELEDIGRVYDPPLAGYTAIFLNVRHPYFRDVNTRRAIEHAIDRESMVETILNGRADQGTSPIPLMSSAHAPGDHADFDPEQAELLLESDGWIRQSGDQIRQRDGEYFLVPLIVNSGDSQRIAVANLIQEQLREVGISVDVQVMANDDLQQALQSRQFTAAMYGWKTTTGSLDGFQMWHSTRSEGGMNFTGFADSRADEFLMSARRAATSDERNQQYEGFQQIFAEQVPAVVLFYPRYHFAVSDRIEGVEPQPLVDPGDRVRQIQEWQAGNS